MLANVQEQMALASHYGKNGHSSPINFLAIIELNFMVVQSCTFPSFNVDSNPALPVGSFHV
jgi:hypothetical protein